jgi:molecular chaperone Hsp33
VSNAFTDQIQPFMIDAGAIRGRLVRLGPALDSILSGHGYPGPVAERLAETLALAAALAGSLKFDGIFTLQLQSEGALPLVVADITSAGHLRGYARYDEEKLAAAIAAEGSIVQRFFTKGYLAFTVDQGPDTDRYQGIVELTGDTLADCAHEYFRQSEQLDTGFRLAVRAADQSRGESAGHGWQAAVIMIQRMPTGPQSPILTADEAEEAWRRAEIMMDSAKESELFDADLTADRLIYRLYHADGLHLYDNRSLEARCRCSAERVEGTLKSFPREQVEEMKDENGVVAVVCEFCKTGYHFSDSDLDRLYGA